MRHVRRSPLPPSNSAKGKGSWLFSRPTPSNWRTRSRWSAAPRPSKGCWAPRTSGSSSRSPAPRGWSRVPMLVADKVVMLDEKNKEKYPAVNHAVIEGEVVKGEVKAGAGVVRVVGPGRRGQDSAGDAEGGTPPKDGARVRASGKVRVAGGQLVPRSRQGRNDQEVNWAVTPALLLSCRPAVRFSHARGVPPCAAQSCSWPSRRRPSRRPRPPGPRVRQTT